jgi:hypothetical protein
MLPPSSGSKTLVPLVRGDNVSHDCLGREHLATVSPMSCLCVSVEVKLTSRNFVECDDQSPFTLKMEATCSSKTPVLTRTTRRHHILESSILHCYRRENIKSYSSGWYLARIFLRSPLLQIESFFLDKMSSRSPIHVRLLSQSKRQYATSPKVACSTPNQR